MKFRIFLLSFICCWSSLDAQQDPRAFVSVGRGLVINKYHNDPDVLWKPEPNTSVDVGYRILPGLFLVGYFDHNTFSFQGYYQNVQSTGSYSLNSFLLGGKASATIPGKILSPYFLGLVGLSWAASTQDTVFSTSKFGDLLVYHAIKGRTLTFLGAAGTDIRIYKGLFAYVEVRVSAGFDSDVYDLLFMWRVGIGFALF